MASRSPIFIFSLLFFIALLALFPGIGEITGITGKDEYYLTIRTPMHMLEGSHGWLPWLDGLPRLKKPPLIYWLGKINFDLFGVSLTSARLVGVVFAATLVISSAALSLLINKDKNQAFLTGLVMLGMAGIMIDGRRFLLDIPVAAFSGVSILFLLLWDRKRSLAYLSLSMVFLGLAFLVKGPVAFIFYFPALAAWLITRPNATQHAWNWNQWFASLMIVVMIVLPWYVYLYQLYPEALTNTLAQEVNDREILTFSLSPILNLIVLALPWSIIAIALLIKNFRSNPNTRIRVPSSVKFLLLWLLLTLLPFFFFKTFGRYLYGCLIPLSILITVLLSHHNDVSVLKRWFQTSAIISSLIGLVLFLIVFLFRGLDYTTSFAFILITIFIYHWWQAKNATVLAVTSIVYWFSVTALIYPRIGINAIPVGTENIIKDEYTVLYAGPQPAMLPISVKRGLRATSRLWTLPPEVLTNCKGFLLFSPENKLRMAKKQMSDLELDYQVLSKDRILSSRGSWARFTSKGTTLSDWMRALHERDLDSLGTEVLLLRVSSKNCRNTELRYHD